MDIVDVDSRLVLPPCCHSTGGLDGGFELGSGDVPVVAAEQVFIADAVFFDCAVYGWIAVLRAFGFGCCDGGGGEEEEE